MALITTSTNLFPPELVKEVFSKVKGHSTLAALSGETPLPFAGISEFTFSMDGEVSIVGEGAAKPAGDAAFTPVTIKPIKLIYQHRLTDEFVKMSEEQQIPYIEAFAEGFRAKIGRGLDITAIHGVNPADNVASSAIGNNCFDKLVTNKVTYAAGSVDENIDDAVALVQAADGEVNGIAFSQIAAAAMGKIKAAGTGTYMYPEFRFGRNPGNLGGMRSDNNTTISFGNSKDRAIVGDFQNAFKWGFSEMVPMEIIQYGDPDGQGDLKRNNQIVLRAEAYVGWGILSKDSFAMVAEANG